MIPSELAGILESTPDTLSGAVRFAGTRIHVKLLFDYVLTGETLSEFLENYPEVNRSAAQAVLDWELKRMENVFELERAS